MRTTNAERLKKHHAKMKAAGFIRINAWIDKSLVDKLDAEKQQGECRGRTLERLLLGKAVKRPEYWERQERIERYRKRQRSRKHKLLEGVPDFLLRPKSGARHD